MFLQQSEVIRLLENFSLYHEDQLDFILYELEQIVYLCVNSQNIWRDFLTDEIIQRLFTTYNPRFCPRSDAIKYGSPIFFSV